MAVRFKDILTLIGFLAATGFPDGCHPGYRAPLQGAAGRGEALYHANCKPCHEDPALELRTKPPSLAGLFERKVLPSGAPATDEQVRVTIQQGKGIMPPFGHILNNQNIDDLIVYLHGRKQ